MLLSVIIPVFNGAEYISRCLDRILCQDLVDYEILVIDDGSTDGTASIVENYALSHPGIIRLLRQTNSGQGIARNKGIMEAQGEYLSFVDADDYIEDNSYPFLLSQMKENSLDLLCCNYRKVDILGHEVRKNEVENLTKYPMQGIIVTDAPNFLYNHFGILCYTWLFIYRRNYVISTGLLFKPKIYLEDAEWLSKLIVNAKRIGLINFCFYNYIQTPNSSMRNSCDYYIKKRIDDTFYVVKLLHEYESSLKNFKLKDWFTEMRSYLEIVLFHMAMYKQYTAYKNYILTKLKKLDYPLKIARVKRYKITAICLGISWRFTELLYGFVFNILWFLRLK